MLVERTYATAMRDLVFFYPEKRLKRARQMEPAFPGSFRNADSSKYASEQTMLL